MLDLALAVHISVLSKQWNVAMWPVDLCCILAIALVWYLLVKFGSVKLAKEVRFGQWSELNQPPEKIMDISNNVRESYLNV